MKTKMRIGIVFIAVVLMFVGFLCWCRKNKGTETESREIPTTTAVPEPAVTNTLVPKPTAANTPIPMPSITPKQNPDAINTPVPEISHTPTPEPVLTNTPVPTKAITSTPESMEPDKPVPTLTVVPMPTELPKPTSTPKPSKPASTPKPTATPLPVYNPKEYGYTEKVGEWKYGENITATLWWNGIKWGNDGKACVLVFEGMGETWTKEESNSFYNRTSRPWIGVKDYRDYIYEVVVGEGITKVSYLQLDNIKNIILPNSLYEIGKHAFSSSKVTFFAIPEGVKRIEDYAFYCSELTSVVIPEGVEYIGECAFDRCHLTEIHLPDSLKFLGSAAFGMQYVVNAEENQVSEVVIPVGVEKIGFGAFIGRYGMKIYLEGRSSDAGFDKGWNDGGFDREIEVVYNYKK